jgi:carbon monoxide dehydrogenase subunit G
MKVERTIEIDAPPERVWDVLMDARRLEQWVTIHERLEHAPDGDLSEGAELSQTMKLAGRCFTVDWRVVEDARPRRVVWEGRGPVRSRARVVYEVGSNGDGGSRFSYTNEYGLPGGVLGRIGSSAVAPLSQRESERSLERLKALLER